MDDHAGGADMVAFDLERDPVEGGALEADATPHVFERVTLQSELRGHGGGPVKVLVPRRILG
jgi:hypothetical protein